MNYFEPYQSCFLFGALRYFSNLKDSVSLINGPTGCSFYTRNSVLNLNGYFDKLENVFIPKIFTTGFNEKDVIFGNEHNVRNALEEIICKYHPKMIFIFNCCVSEIIGVDIDTIANDIYEKEGIIIVPIHSAGFKGDNIYGMKTASSIMCQYFFKEKKGVETSKVNILGDFDYFHRSTKELTLQLKKIGIDNVLHVPGHCSLEELEDVPNATLNIITCQNASRHMAEILKRKFDTPYIGDGLSLYGLEASLEFYSLIYKYFDCNLTNLFSEYNLFKSKIMPYVKKIKGKKAIVVAGLKRSIGYSNILKELGLDVVLLFSENTEEYISQDVFLKYSQNIMINEHIDDLSHRIAELYPDVVFTTIPEMIAPNSFLPRLTDDFSGFSGILRMAEYLSDYFDHTHLSNSNTVLINN